MCRRAAENAATRGAKRLFSNRSPRFIMRASPFERKRICTGGGRNPEMSTLPSHFYETALMWQGKRRGTATAPGLPALPFSTPPEFNGEAGYWTPEHVFVVSAEMCLMATFVAIAEKMHVPVVAYSSTARGKLDWIDGEGYKFTELEIQPMIELESEADREKALRALEKAEKGCLVTRSMTSRIRVTADIHIAAVARP